VARLVSDGEDAESAAGKGRDVLWLTGALASSARRAGKASVFGGRWLTDLLIETAPRLPMRDLATLRSQHPGLPDEDLAEAIISGAAKATGAVGAAGGALAAVEFTAPPALLSTPFQIAAETLMIAAIEVKMIAELHEVYGFAPAGPSRQRAASYLMAWTNRRAIAPLDEGGVRLSLGPTAKVALRRRMVRRAGRNLSTMGPMLTGAVAGSMVNHRETRKLGGQVRQDLRARWVRERSQQGR